MYVAIISKPNCPYLREIDGIYELIPGENHWETNVYFVYRDGKHITDKPVTPGTAFIAPETGTYTAAVVEWLGLESEQSIPLYIPVKTKHIIKSERPADFTWTSDRWIVKKENFDKDTALSSEKVVREVMHLYNGVIRQE